jgi:hypothetical protein
MDKLINGKWYELKEDTTDTPVCSKCSFFYMDYKKITISHTEREERRTNCHNNECDKLENGKTKYFYYIKKDSTA